MTTVEGIAPVREFLLGLCVSGEGHINWTGITALQTTVTLRMALELDALRIRAQDHRHTWQDWYPKYTDQRRKQAQIAGTSTPVAGDELSLDALKDEAEMIRQSIIAHDDMLAAHRLALYEGRTSDMLPDIQADAIYATLEQLRNQLPAVSSAVAELSEGVE